MYFLLIETSTERGLTAILENEELLFQGELPPGHQNSKYLLPEIEKGLKSKSLEIKDLGYIAVGIGPGSYTGIRVGVTAAKTLAFAGGLPLIGLCTLETFVPDQDGNFAVLIDAKIGGAYVVTGCKQKGKITYSSSPRVAELNKLEDLLKQVDYIVSPNITVLKPKLELIYPGQNWEWQERSPDPWQMGRHASDKFRRGEYTMDGHLELLYMRKTQAEIERDTGHNK